MISFVNFARIASICVGFDLGTLHGYFFHEDFWPNLNFPLEYQIKLVLICMSESKSLFGDYHEMADIWARIEAFDQLFMIPTVQT